MLAWRGGTVRVRSRPSDNPQTPGSLEQRTSRLEGSHEQMNERLADLASLRAEMNGRFAEIDRRFSSLNVLLYTLGAGIIGVLIAQVFTLLQVVASD